MDEHETESELWKRKFEPISDWKPAGEPSGPFSGARGVLEGAIEGIEKGKDALTRMVGPLSEEAKTKITDALGVLEDVAVKSSTEARSSLANLLEAMAQKIRPKH